MAPPKPKSLAYVVGDLHGCLRALEDVLKLIADDAAGAPAQLVFVGDYTDRGPDSPGTLRRLMELDRKNAANVHCLLGNHDRMLLNFLDKMPNAARWLDNGGFDTLMNFNVSHLRANSPEERHAIQAEALAKAMGPDLVAWLRLRPLYWQSGNLIAVHALTDPARPMAEQDETTMLWARPGRDLRPREDGKWVVHGHTVVREPSVRAGHIAIDTGAYRGKGLTAAVFDGGPVRFLTAPSQKFV